MSNSCCGVLKIFLSECRVVECRDNKLKKILYLQNFYDKNIGVENNINKQIKRVLMIQLLIGKTLFLCI